MKPSKQHVRHVTKPSRKWLSQCAQPLLAADTKNHHQQVTMPWSCSPTKTWATLPAIDLNKSSKMPKAAPKILVLQWQIRRPLWAPLAGFSASLTLHCAQALTLIPVSPQGHVLSLTIEKSWCPQFVDSFLGLIIYLGFNYQLSAWWHRRQTRC
jgi:hypothetical protein